MTVSLFRTRTLSDTGALDRRLYTSPHSLRITPRIPGPVKPSRNSFHGGKLLSAMRLSSSHCTRPHPCTVTAAHHPHTRPPDIQARLAYQRSLLNTYSTSDLGRLRAPQRNRPRLALALTRSGAGVDLLGIPRDMSDDDATAARGGFGSRAHRSDAHCEDRDSSRAWRAGDFPAPALFVNCRVKWSSATRMFLVTSGASFRPLAFNSAGF
jgi:hypothetical protein